MQINSSTLTINWGFLIVISLALLLTSVSIYTVYLNASNNSMLIKQKKQLDYIYKMRNAAQERYLMIHRALLSEDVFEVDEIIMKFYLQAQYFIQARDAFIDGNKNIEVLNIWNNIKPVIRRGSATQNRVVLLIRQEKYNDARTLIREESNRNQDYILLSLGILYNKLSEVVSMELVQIESDNKIAYVSIVSFGLLTLIISLLTSFYVNFRNRTNESIIRSKIELVECANRSKSDFLSNMSHEIRTPLTAIIGFSNMLLSRTLAKDSSDEYVGTIIRNGRHLLQLINDILDISKIEAGQLLVENISTSPFEVVDDAISILANQAQEKGVTLTAEYSFPLPLLIHSDPVRLMQVILNLCSNAIKFTEEGFVVIRVDYIPLNNQLVITVKDSGIGIAPDKLESIFGYFTQADNSVTRRFGGSGLGLCIAKELTNKLNGKLICHSALGKGSSFILTLELTEVDDMELVHSLDSISNNGLGKNLKLDRIPLLKGRILLAEDNIDNQKLIEIYVKRTGADIYIVENGELAIRATHQGSFDLILMDMQMPVMDGLTAIKRLRSERNITPIVFLSANALHSDKQEAFSVGANDYVVKPIDLRQFYSVLEKYLPSKIQNVSRKDLLSLADVDELKVLSLKFVNSLPDKMQILLEGYKCRNYSTLETISHQLKGIGSEFGFVEITNLAASVNLILLNKQYDDLENAISNLVECCTKIQYDQAS